MKTKLILTGATALLAFSTTLAFAQPADGDTDGRRGPRGPGGPAPLARFDANKDGTLDASEIAAAGTVLKGLDKNGDGVITPDEFRPERPANATDDAPPAPPADGTKPAKMAGKRGPGGPGGPGPFALFDGDHDGVIDADEIALAPDTLKALDKDGDGILSPAEMRPPGRGGEGRGQGKRGAGGPPPSAD